MKTLFIVLGTLIFAVTIWSTISLRKSRKDSANMADPVLQRSRRYEVLICGFVSVLYTSMYFTRGDLLDLTLCVLVATYIGYGNYISIEMRKTEKGMDRDLEILREKPFEKL
tara:strand:+ start:382 stop:717 length:336 start_codon:yes stop_codon:yes gene_type:complete